MMPVESGPHAPRFRLAPGASHFRQLRDIRDRPPGEKPDDDELQLAGPDCCGRETRHAIDQSHQEAIPRRTASPSIYTKTDPTAIRSSGSGLSLDTDLPLKSPVFAIASRLRRGNSRIVRVGETEGGTKYINNPYDRPTPRSAACSRPVPVRRVRPTGSPPTGRARRPTRSDAWTWCNSGLLALGSEPALRLQRHESSIPVDREPEPVAHDRMNPQEWQTGSDRQCVRHHGGYRESPDPQAAIASRIPRIFPSWSR